VRVPTGDERAKRIYETNRKLRFRTSIREGEGGVWRKVNATYMVQFGEAILRD